MDIGAPQIGQDAVVAMCAWHHAGDVLFGIGVEAMRATYGPSFHHHARDFRAWTADVLPDLGLGTEAWQAVQNTLLLSQGNGHLIPAQRREVIA